MVEKVSTVRKYTINGTKHYISWDTFESLVMLPWTLEIRNIATNMVQYQLVTWAIFINIRLNVMYPLRHVFQ